MNRQPTTALYQTIYQDLKNQILSGQLPAGTKLPTEKQLLSQYQVSRITITKALTLLKQEGFIIRHPRRGSFVCLPDGIAPRKQLLKTTSQPAAKADIACIFPFIRDHFSLSMVNGVLSVFPTDSYLFHTFQSRTPDHEADLLAYCLEHQFAGIVLFPLDLSSVNPVMKKMEQSDYPLVFIDRCLPALNTASIMSDNKKGGALCLRHLYQLGHQRICFVTTGKKESYSVSQRLAGIYEEASRLHIPASAIYLQEDLDITQKQFHYQEFFYRLLYQERVTAFIASESDTCIYLYQVFHSLNIQIPEQISLMSFDRPFSELTPPNFFTYIDQSEALLGREAGLLLKDLIKKRYVENRQRLLAPILKTHTSTGERLL